MNKTATPEPAFSAAAAAVANSADCIHQVCAQGLSLPNNALVFAEHMPDLEAPNPAYVLAQPRAAVPFTRSRTLVYQTFAPASLRTILRV